jgi:ribosomal protein S18 acetylase RimI-like enzyme
MALTYFKRFRMELDLRGRDFSRVALPSRFRFVPWTRSLLEAHAEAKYSSFRAELDSSVFPCLGEFSGCLRLMEEIAGKGGFLPEATWLIREESVGDEGEPYCGTVQGVIDRNGMGAIQNLGILPQYRQMGLGSALMLQSLGGFQRAGLRRVFLEVTAQNSAAVRLYKRLGFAKVRTVYKVADVAYA